MMIPTRRRESTSNGGEPWQSATPYHADDLAVKKIPFEARKGGYSELAGGISLYVGSIDLRHRRIGGWMWVADDHRHIWIRDQNVGEPIVVCGSSDGQQRELVITGVSKSSVTGYVRLPKKTAQLH
jgi:hypothetical protein